MNDFTKTTAVLLIGFFLVSSVLQGTAVGITQEEEETLSKEFLKITLAHYDLVEDPLIVDYVNKVGHRVASRLDNPPFQFHFYVIRQDVYNAFAGPAGHIFINSGLLEGLKSENELAGILGHEISHVACRHISEMVDRSKKTTLVTLAGIATGIFLGISGAPTAASAVTVGSIAAGATATLAYSREDEMEADQIALKYLAKAGYSGDGLLNALKLIRSRNWYGSDQIPAYLTTHPAAEDRIAYISSCMKDQPEELSHSGEDEFIIMRTRLTALYGEERMARKKFETALNNQPDDYLSNYGYGLVLSRVGDNMGAVKHFRKALSIKPLDQMVIRELGRVYFLNGDYQQAYVMLKDAARPSSTDADVRFYLGRTLKALGKTKQAIWELEQLLSEHPGFVPAYYHLGIIYGEQEMLGEAHYYLGLYYRKKRQNRNAVFHLKRAVQHLTAMKKKQKAEAELKSVGVGDDPQKDARPDSSGFVQWVPRPFFPVQLETFLP